MLRRTNPDDGLNPAFAEEQAKLDEVVRYIEEDWVRIQRTLPAKAAYQDTANAIQRILLERQDSLDSALRQPYFGRLDYIVTDGPPVVMVNAAGDDENPRPPQKTVYLGITSITERGISSWTAPIAKLWYTPSRQDGYTAPAGHVSTLVDLKRYLRIRNQKLVDVNDIFRRLLPASSQEPNQALTDALSQTGAEDRQLQIIIETIEPEQYESISNTSDKVLVVQGAAGSGQREKRDRVPPDCLPSLTFQRRSGEGASHTAVHPLHGAVAGFLGICFRRPPPARGSRTCTTNEVQPMDHWSDVQASADRRQDLEEPAGARGEPALQRTGRAFQGIDVDGRRH